MIFNDRFIQPTQAQLNEANIPLPRAFNHFLREVGLHQDGDRAFVRDSFRHSGDQADLF